MRIGLRVTFISYTKSSAKPLQSRQHAIQGIYSPNPFKERKKLETGRERGSTRGKEREGKRSGRNGAKTVEMPLSWRKFELRGSLYFTPVTDQGREFAHNMCLLAKFCLDRFILLPPRSENPTKIPQFRYFEIWGFPGLLCPHPFTNWGSNLGR